MALSLFTPSSTAAPKPHWTPETLADAIPRRGQAHLDAGHPDSVRFDIAQFDFVPPADAEANHRPRRPIAYAPSPVAVSMCLVRG